MSDRSMVAVALSPGERQLVVRAIRLLVEAEGDSRQASNVLEMLTDTPHVAELRRLTEGSELA